MVDFTCMQNVKIMVGVNCHKNMGNALKEAGYKKAFVVYDSGVKAAGIINKVIDSLKNSGIDVVEFDKVLPDPPAEVVDEGGFICLQEECDCVVGIGGGSAIDTAKGINILRVNGGHILEYANPEKEMKKSLGLMSVPTTSGTGSELSNGLIISDTANDMKAAILAKNGMSEFAVIDPVFSAGMPLGLTVMTGLDAFSHAAEGYTTNLANPMSDMITKAIMENVVENLPKVIKDGNDMEARTKMHVAASLGGWMLANSSAHVGHSIAHVIGGMYHIPHGACCAYSLPVVLEEISAALPDKVKDIGEILGAQFDGGESPEKIGKKASEAYMKFAYETIGVKKVEDYMTEPVDIDKLSERVVTEPLAGLAPISVTKEAATNMLRKIFKLF
ncbi:MAG: iron-containing alcohol dehydrogenase [Coprococcus sp.]